jgi:hypothetical protein
MSLNTTIVVEKPMMTIIERERKKEGRGIMDTLTSLMGVFGRTGRKVFILSFLFIFYFNFNLQ